MTQNTTQYPQDTVVSPVSAADALPDSAVALTISPRHTVTGHDVNHVPDGFDTAYFAMGCFWGVERLFWQQPGVYSTTAGYTGGTTKNPAYEGVCTGNTGHAEAVRVVYDPSVISYADLLRLFWENHDPAQGMKQGGDIGSQYRSAIYTQSDSQRVQALASREQYQQAMNENNDSRSITTAIRPLGPFYVAEDYHQQYLDKNPEGYCGLGGIGVCLPPSLRN
ncbi:peptide-methionine (S)-S-oxide reductase MsrA [Morganella morganii]|uniref:peptide-methionine (S)-S-oxide reductase MsrA n=1 Tax=Morganella morganii TaxID=582 RepID=UPI001967DB8A|nr:peptide-methionine (S)-S-oxide reductase MsrA [Morganella morganii]EKT0593169.1 peptide-methionine (S)-S-oxide reductase MsrA [Morganella morganii]ELF0883524.1 peptide-methionine (S)-S-oxide reductase MsrA [Morganella morganii]MBT0390046.1 peptide-methionine (S)-S-oxide reductase MsrA [Morganella morganii subsp. morganii]MBT0519985.1 peptide-methionine (S)-S-oxide reductase MsrA [Morganella morganii subsp. morganii]QWL89941.1 peptide-methionine (S)-S-oxide reductase MsrA [Morganella morgani